MSGEIPLTFRTDNFDSDKWGAGKGSNLTPEEVDENFWAIAEELEDLRDNPPLPLNIANITVSGNQMTIVMSDSSTFGPFTLPTATFRWRGAWQPSTSYLYADLFTTNDGMWLVVKDHTSSGTSFSPSDGDMDGPFQQLIFPYPNVYDVAFSFPGLPGLGIVDGEAMFSFVAAHPFYLLADLPESIATLRVAATDPLTLHIFKNDTEIGTCTFESLDSVGSSDSESHDGIFSFADDVQFYPGDRLRILKPATLDATAFDLAMNFAGHKGIPS